MSDKPRPMPTAVAATDRSPYHGYRFPPEIIAHAVWLYFRFHLSFRDVQDLLAERGIIVSHEAIRQWCTKFGAAFASGLRRRRARPGDKWHIDEVLLKISGKRHWLWRAVDQYGVVLDILVQSRRDQLAAERFLRQVVDGVGYEPRVVITDKLASYPPAIRKVLPNTEHRRHKRLNNRAENSPPADAQTRAGTSAVQIRRARAAFPGTVQRRQQPLPSASTSLHRFRLSTTPHRASRRLAGYHPGRAPMRPSRTNLLTPPAARLCLRIAQVDSENVQAVPRPDLTRKLTDLVSSS